MHIEVRQLASSRKGTGMTEEPSYNWLETLVERDKWEAEGGMLSDAAHKEAVEQAATSLKKGTDMADTFTVRCEQDGAAPTIITGVSRVDIQWRNFGGTMPIKADAGTTLRLRLEETEQVFVRPHSFEGEGPVVEVKRREIRE